MTSSSIERPQNIGIKAFEIYIPGQVCLLFIPSIHTLSAHPYELATLD